VHALSSDTESFQAGVGPHLSLFRDIVRGGWGYNLSADSNRGYVFVSHRDLRGDQRDRDADDRSLRRVAVEASVTRSRREKDGRAAALTRAQRR
jgi:hypothetical protein